MRKTLMIIVVCVGTFLVSHASAQVVREEGTGSIVGTLDGFSDWFDDYQFKVRRPHVLFADLDAELYINKTDHHEEAAEKADAHEEEACGGAARFMLQVFDKYGSLVCHVSKPLRPGWETDPRMACLLNDDGNYLLRVGLKGKEGVEGVPAESNEIFVYLLSVSLRALATDDSPSDLRKALKESRNTFPNNN